MKKPAILILLCSSASMFCADATGLRIGAPLPTGQTGAIVANVCTIDAANKACAWIFQAQAAAAVTTLLFHYGTRGGTPVQHRISIQGVNAGSGIGMPNGTVAAAAAFTPPADTSWDMTGTALAGCVTSNNCMQAASIANDGAGASISSLTLTRGTYYAIVIETCPNATAPCTASVSADATNKSTFVSSVTNIGTFGRTAVPYALTNAAALPSTTWTKLTDTPIFGYRSASTTYGTPLLGNTSTVTNVNAEIGVSFNIPAAWWSSYKVLGIRFIGQTPAVNSSVKVSLYNGNGAAAPIQTLTWDSDIIRVNATALESFTLYFSDTTLQTLNAGTTYRIGISPQGAGTGIAMATLDLLAAGDRAAFPGGTNFAYTTRTGCSGACDAQTAVTFTDTNTSRPLLELILDDITAPISTATTSASVH